MPIRGELDLIAAVRTRFAGLERGRGGRIRLGIGDDCAVLQPPEGSEVLVTTDLLLEGRHFRRDTHPAASAGYRCLARGLSDIAAMGGRPMAAFLSLAVPAWMSSTSEGRRWVDEFLEGLHTLAAAAGTPLAGGDTAQAPGDQLLADIVLLGACPAGRALRRSGARAGDRLFCTGALGGAAAELHEMFARAEGSGAAAPRLPADWRQRAAAGTWPQRFPQPRLAVGEALQRRALASAAIDVSDGLSTDLAHLCEASGVRAEVWELALPAHVLTEAFLPAEARAAKLHGGEDYELLFTAPAAAKLPRRIAGVALTEIGRILPVEAGDPLVTLVGEGGHESLEPGGWEHFRTAANAPSIDGADAPTTDTIRQRRRR